MNDPETNNTDPEPGLTPEQVQEAFAAAEQKAADAQEFHIQAAQHAGYTREVIRVAAPFYMQLAEIAQDKPDLYPILATGINVVNSICSELEQAARLAKPLIPGLYAISASADTFINNAGTAAITISPRNIESLSVEAPPFFSPDESAIEKKLSLLDPSLSDTYREIGQAYHGTTADPARAAIGLMRQTFDHFFSILAPDDMVRASLYWKRKSGPEPDQVTRKERMTYAARTHIRDQARSDTIVANINNILATYQMLNKLHKRGALSERQARKALKTMKRFIETWADALET